MPRSARISSVSIAMVLVTFFVSAQGICNVVFVNPPNMSRLIVLTLGTADLRRLTQKMIRWLKTSLLRITQKAVQVMLRKTVLVMTPSSWGSPPDASEEDPPPGACPAANADLSSLMLSSAEVHVLDSQGMVLPKTPLADEVLLDLLSNNEGHDGDFSTADGDS